MTLFAFVCGDRSPFHDALVKFFHGQDDAKTIRLLQAVPPVPPYSIASHAL